MTSIYSFKNGLRLVKEYKHEFVAFTKKRWIGQTLLDIYTKEFLANTKSYYEESIASGKISVNGEAVTSYYKLKDCDKIVHAVTRRETPVLEDPKIEILYEDENLLAVDKPPSMPVHEGGSYKYNTFLGILEHDMGYKGLKCVNRLDKQTSGVVYLAKNEKTANDFREGL